MLQPRAGLAGKRALKETEETIAVMLFSVCIKTFQGFEGYWNYEGWIRRQEVQACSAPQSVLWASLPWQMEHSFRKGFTGMYLGECITQKWWSDEWAVKVISMDVEYNVSGTLSHTWCHVDFISSLILCVWEVSSGDDLQTGRRHFHS